MFRNLFITARGVLTLSGLAAAMSSTPAAAQVWTDWTAMTAGSAGSAVGTMAFPGSAPIGVGYTGQLLSGSQTGCGTSWFSDSYPAYDGTPIAGSPVSSYTSPLPCDMIQIDAIGSYRFTFSAPVVNPFMAFVSIGQPGVPVNYDFFNAPFAIVDEGRGPWGDGSLTELSGDVLEGREGHGVIQFTGTYSSLEWTVSPGEHWHGFTVGATGPTSTVPEPMSIALLGTGLAALAGMKWRRRKETE